MGESLRECEHVLISEKCPLKICVYNIYFSATAFPGVSFSARRLGGQWGQGREGAAVCFPLHREERNY